jgi:hypothetical protein
MPVKIRFWEIGEYSAFCCVGNDVLILSRVGNLIIASPDVAGLLPPPHDAVKAAIKTNIIKTDIILSLLFMNLPSHFNKIYN